MFLLVTKFNINLLLPACTMKGYTVCLIKYNYLCIVLSCCVVAFTYSDSSNLRNLDFKVRGRDGLLKQGQHRVGKVERLVTGIIAFMVYPPLSLLDRELRIPKRCSLHLCRIQA